jgi:hypothetical protein
MSWYEDHDNLEKYTTAEFNIASYLNYGVNASDFNHWLEIENYANTDNRE